MLGARNGSKLFRVDELVLDDHVGISSLLHRSIRDVWVNKTQNAHFLLGLSSSPDLIATDDEQLRRE